MKSILLGIAVAHLGVATLSAATLFTFDASSLTTTTGDLLPTTVAINYAYLVDKDANGDPLAVPYFDVDPTAPLVTASSPLLAGYGPDIDGDALDGVLSPIMFTFAHPLDITGFRAMLDDSTYGTPAGFGTAIEFYTSFGALIGSIGIDQATASFEAIGAGPFNGVSKMVLPSGAFYDNVEFNGVSSIPEPGSLVAVGCFLSAGLFLRSRRNLTKA